MKVKRSKFINDVRHHIADKREAEAIADLAEQAGVQWDPEVDLRPCPNPECVLEEGVVLERSQTGSWVSCDDCDMVGPYNTDEAEAIRLWNLLPRTQDEVPAGDLGEREGLMMDPGDPGLIVDFGEIWLDLTLVDEERPLSPSELEKIQELLARYNVVSLLLEEYGMATTPKNIGPRLLRALQEEREKLR